MQKRAFWQRVKRVRARERKLGQKARDSVAGLEGAGGIEFSHEIVAQIYLVVNKNRRNNKILGIGG